MADLKGVLENVDRELNPELPPEVTKFAPQRLRGETLTGLYDELRKEVNDGKRRQEAILVRIKAFIDDQLRAIG